MISIDHRLAPQVKIGEILQDVLDACCWAREKLPAILGMKLGKLFVAGGSAGAHLALLTGFKLDPPPTGAALRVLQFRASMN